MSNTYIIVGAGIAGIAAAEAIREIDSQGPVIMFTAEHNLPYSRPMLTKTPFTVLIRTNGPYTALSGSTQTA